MATPGLYRETSQAIKPAVTKAKNESAKNETVKDALLNDSIDANIDNIVDDLNNSEPMLSEYIKEGKLKIVGARYHLDSGKVDLIE